MQPKHHHLAKALPVSVSGADKAAESTYKLHHMCTYMLQGSIPLCRTLQHIPSDPFTISQENTEGFGCLPPGAIFGGEKEDRN